MKPLLFPSFLLAALISLPLHAAEVTIFAAASLKDALDAVAARWQTESGNTAVIAYGGSSALAKQIEQGAPADLFLSAAVSWMDELEKAALILPGSRTDLWGNTLVLVAHGKDAAPVQIAAGLDLAGMLGGGKLAMALVDSVPAGQYGKEALTSLGLWPSVEPSVVQSENVRATLALVALGEAPFGIVYGSDVMAGIAAGDAVSLAGTFPAGSHKPITYPGALVAGARPAAAAFLAYLASPAAAAIFTAQGFTVLD